MQLDRCRSCGGELERVGNSYVCKFCGSKWVIDADQDVHVIDRANAWSALRDCDFEHAVELFENIIFKEPENHEAYWGRALASAGIMYVTDLDEHKKVPTCNNISEESFIESNDVKRAIALAPDDIADTYKKQSEQIENIRAEWVKKASKEKPYDVFICFKDSDREHNIDRTDDSYDAHELYNALTEEGYKVFFSRVSLRDKIAEHYEPYIYNALKTAKVMIVFGEKPEYFNAVWVKNEWSRFRAMIERGEKHKNSLVAVYKNMIPAELPAGLRSRQCLDAGEIKFLEILKQHIERIINAPQDRTMADAFVPEPPKKKKKWPILAIIAGVLALAITLGVVIPSLTKNRNEETTESIEETTESIEETTESIEETTESIEETTESIEETTESTKDATDSVPVSTERTETETATQGIPNETTQTEAGNHDETETKQGETQDGEMSAPESPIIENADFGITVDPVENTLPSSTSLDVEHIVSGNKYDAVSSALNEVVERFYAYDMRLSIYGNHLSITEKVVVTIPLPSDIPADQEVIYYVSDDGIATEIPSTVENGKISFETDHFSIYVVAQRKLPRSTIIFNANGGSGLMENAVVYSSQITTLPKSAFTKQGYHMAGWSHTADGEIVAFDNENYQVGANPIYNLYVVWAPNTNNITLDTNGGNCDSETLVVTYDKEYILPEPEWAGHTFSGWFLGDNRFEDGVWTNLENITLVAKWDVIVYDITYDLDGGEAENVNNYNTDDGATIDDPTKTGYTFLGWTYEGQTEPQKNVTIPAGTIGDLIFVAHWQANQYKITFDANGGECNDNEMDVTFDGDVVLPVSEMEGHEFGGWFLDGNKIDVSVWNIAKDVTLVAKWDIITYDITYNLDGGTASNVNSYDTENGANIADPTKIGYTFLGWTYTGQSEYEKNVVINPGTIGDIEFVAHWQPNKYTITLDANGGECDKTKLDVTYDAEYTLPEPEWAGHTFSGWFSSNSQVTGGTWKGTTDIALTAKWDIIKYTVTYDLDGGTNGAGNPTEYTVDDSFSLAEPVRTGYSFLGWTYEGQTTPIKSVRVEKGTIGNKTYTANWSANTYTITFNANSGSVTTPTLEATFDTNTVLPTPTRTGYRFDGWFNGTTQYTTGTWKHDGDITLTAKWTANSYKASYNADGGTVSNSYKNYTFDASYTLLTPTRTGYEFLGWYNGDKLVSQSGVWTFDSDISLKAKWQAKTYTVTFDAGVGTSSMPSAQATYDSNFTLATAERVGYTFDGWYYNGTKYSSGAWKTDESITLTAKWTARKDIAYVVNHHQQNIEDNNYTLYSTQNLTGTSDASITPSVNTYTGFTAPSAKTETIKPDGTLVVDYYYTRNSYTITLVTNGGTDTAITQKYQSALTPETWTTREGYTFGGWFTDSKLTREYAYTTMPANNATIYAWWQEENKPSDFTYSGTTAITINSYVGTSTTMWIPMYIGGVPVTTIPASAFKDQTTLLKVVVPDTVTMIGDGAFKGCDTLEDITIPFVGMNETTTSIEHRGFGYIFGVNSGYNFTIQTGATLHHSEYYNATGNTYRIYYYIPQTIRNVTITKQTVIPTSAFKNCDFIENIMLPTTIESIGEYAFYNCKALTKISLGSNLSSIGNYAFANCISLESIILPNSVESIGNYAFSECASLKKMNSDVGGILALPTGLNVIPSYAFKGCAEITKVVIGNNITNIADYAFADCINITQFNSDNTNEMIIPNGTTTIGECAFQNLAFITKIVVPNTVTTIGHGAFKGCDTLEDITIPFVGMNETTTSIEHRGFGYIFGVSSGYNFTIQTGATLHHSEYYNATGNTYRIYYYIPQTIRNVTITKQTVIPASAFKNCDFIERITLPSNITSIGEYAFHNCQAITEMNLGTELTAIGDYAFANCISLESVMLPDTVVTIGASAFSNCGLLTRFNSLNEGELIIPSSTTTIGANAFENLLLVTKIVIPDTVLQINTNAFNGCESVEEIVLPFVGTKDDETGSNSKIFSAIFNSGSDIPSSITKVTVSVQTVIPDNAFKNCKYLETIILPVGATAGDNAFYNCTATVSYTYNPTVSIWKGSEVSTSFLGSGTSADPYQINSAADLAYLASSVNAGESYAGKHFVLNININLNTKSWTPIGTKSKPFEGTFDGNGKKIYNLSVTIDTGYAGLFGYVEGAIKNLGIVSGTIAPASTAGSTYAAPLVGYLTGNVENCYSNAEVKVSIKNIVYSGGLIGHIDTNATVKDSYASGHVSGISSSGFAYAGGFVGANKGTIEGCLAFGDVTAKGSNDSYSRNGGFVATNDGTLEECYRSETQKLVQYTTTGSAYCEDGTSDSYSDMIAYAQTNWASTVWEYNLKYPSHK